jgi:hypothetical protein
MDNRPHSKYPHVFAVVRWDGDRSDPENAITVTKVMTDERAARIEVNRLQAVNAAKGSQYFVQTTRLVESRVSTISTWYHFATAPTIISHAPSEIVGLSTHFDIVKANWITDISASAVLQPATSNAQSQPNLRISFLKETAGAGK